MPSELHHDRDMNALLEHAMALKKEHALSLADMHAIATCMIQGAIKTMADAATSEERERAAQIGNKLNERAQREPLVSGLAHALVFQISWKDAVLGEEDAMESIRRFQG